MVFLQQVPSESITARSRAMRQVLGLAQRVARSEAVVLITGESGTGKERLARYIHERSGRSAGPFVGVNCGALPDTLLGSELFGHVKGAFTGAMRNKKGLFEAAEGGTLLLDEVGEMSPAVQVGLLRALQERRVRPVGANKEVSLDVRVIAATNRDLETAVADGGFREDLYYRLRVVSLVIPPLRERPEDIPALAHGFIRQTCSVNGCGPCALTGEVMDVLERYRWPGNIRELENAIERAVILAENRPHIDVSDLPTEVQQSRTDGTVDAGHDNDGSILTLAEVERRHILDVLDRLGGDRKGAAQALGISDNTLWRRLKSYGLVRSRGGL